MPSDRDHLKYEDFGNHDYGDHGGTSACKHGCGCWMGKTMSGSNHAGVDPFGRCPANILRDINNMPDNFGQPLGQTQILNDFINSRIDYLSRKIYYLEPFEKTVKESGKLSKVWLQTRVEYLEQENKKLKCKISNMKDDIIPAIK